MTTLLSRFLLLVSLIKHKQNIYKQKYTFYHMQKVLSPKSQMNLLKNKHFQFSTIAQLAKQLITINSKQLIYFLLISLSALLIRIFAANFNTFLIGYYFQNKNEGIISLTYCIFMLTAYKLTKALLQQTGSYLQMNYGFQGYSAIYYHFLVTKKEITGQILNIIEDDMEKVANLPYSLVNFPFQSITIIVLSCLVGNAMVGEYNLWVIILIIAGLYTVNCISGILVFNLNGTIMKQKDYRLSLNLNKSHSQQQITNARLKQVSLIKRFLFIKVTVKWITQVSFIFIYLLVFLWRNPQIHIKDDQLFYRLMLLGMLKIPFNSLYMETYYIALVLNSLKRIVKCQGREIVKASTIGGFDDFILKNNKKLLNQSIKQRQSLNSSTTSFNQSFSSQQLNSSLSSQFINEEQMQIKQINKQKTSETIQEVSSKQYISQEKSSKTSSIKILQKIKNKYSTNKSKSKYRQKGEIKIIQLLKYTNKNVATCLIISLIIFGLATFFSKFYNLKISNSIIHNQMSSFQTFVFILPSFLYTLFYFTIIFIFISISQNLFKNLNPNQISGQDLNRVSGDIESVDKYVSPYFYEFFIAIFGLLASLAVTISLIGEIYLTIVTGLLLVIIIYLSVYLNRYFMKSRRQIKRSQCKMKSIIIQSYAQRLSSYKDKSQSVDLKLVQRNWKRINICKNIGILIQNFYIFLLNLLVLLIQIIFMIICYYSQLDNKTTKLVLVFILQVDLTLTGLFLGTINLQMGLVNFQRCLNFVKKLQISSSHSTMNEQRMNKVKQQVNKKLGSYYEI